MTTPQRQAADNFLTKHGDRLFWIFQIRSPAHQVAGTKQHVSSVTAPRLAKPITSGTYFPRSMINKSEAAAARGIQVGRFHRGLALPVAQDHGAVVLAPTARVSNAS
jgi:hypothetical protein